MLILDVAHDLLELAREVTHVVVPVLQRAAEAEPAAVDDAGVVERVEHGHVARSGIFSAALPPASVAAASTALDIVEREPERRKQLWENARYLKRELTRLGFDTGESASPVIPVVVGEDEDVYRATIRLEELGVFANPVVSPAVPRGRAMIRTSCIATHTRDHLDRALEAFATMGREIGLIS